MKKGQIGTLSQDMENKLRRAQAATASQRRRVIKCPYCRHNAIVIFEDSRGHVQTKCKRCGMETVFDISEIRRNLL